MSDIEGTAYNAEETADGFSYDYSKSNAFSFRSIAISLKRIADALENSKPLTQVFQDIQTNQFNEFMDKMIDNHTPKEHSSRDDMK